MSCLTILGVEMQAVEMDAQRHHHTQASVDGLRQFEAYCQLLIYGVVKEVQQCCTTLSIISSCTDSLKYHFMQQSHVALLYTVTQKKKPIFFWVHLF